MEKIISKSNLTNKEGQCKIVLPRDYKITEHTELSVNDADGNPREGAMVSNIVENNYEYEFYPSDKDGICRLKCIYKIFKRQVVDEKGDGIEGASVVVSSSHNKEKIFDKSTSDKDGWVIFKVPHQEYNLQKAVSVRAFRSEKFTFRISVGNKKFKIFKIQFQIKNGAIFIHFPYFKNSKGVVGRYVMPAGESESTIQLHDKGRVTSHLVKYSHPPDGNAHFSQDGKVVSEFFNKSFTLQESFHLGSLYLRGLEGFKYIDTEESTSELSKRDQTLNFKLSPDNLSDEFKIVINISSSPDEIIRSMRKVVSTKPLRFSNELSRESVGPRMRSISNMDSKKAHTFLIAPPLESPNNSIPLGE